MFYRKNPTASPAKHVLYLFAATLLGLLLSLIAHALWEMAWLRSLEREGRLAVWYGGCTLPWAIQAFLWIFGGAGGFLLGRFWWRKIYIEKAWCQRKNN